MDTAKIDDSTRNRRGPYFRPTLSAIAHLGASHVTHSTPARMDASSSRLKADRPTAARTRRSQRLIKQQGLPRNTVVVQIEGKKPKPTKRRKLSADSSSFAHVSPAVCAEEPFSGKHRPSCGASCKLNPPEVAYRERALLKWERELQRKSDDLDGRLSQLSKKEEQASLLLSQLAEREAEAILSQLEEHFTCALCYDVMACPISLNPGNCGHTFCALCILRWFFSRLHKACGRWHQPVDCPICRSMLVNTPERLPRSDITFPFVPNRTVENVLHDLITKLADAPLAVKPNEKPRPEKEHTNRPKVVTPQQPARAEAWREDGSMKAEWIRRDRDGREKINHLRKHWPTLTPRQFIEFKAHLRV